MGSRGRVEPERIYPLLSDEDSTVRQATCILIGSIATPGSVPYLVRVIARDKNSDVCRYAAWAMNQIPEEQMLERLSSFFQNTKSQIEKQIAAIGLRQHRYMPIIEDLASQLTTGENKSWHDVNHVVIQEFALLGYYAVEPLISHLQSNDLRKQVNSALALGRIGDGRAAIALTEVLRNIAQDIRPSLSLALVELGKDAVEPVSVLLDDKNKEVRLTAAQVLGSIGEPAVSMLLEILRRRDPNNLEEVIYALGLTRNPETFYPLLKTYEMNKDDKVKAWATISLAHACAYNYKQIENKKDLKRALDIVKDSLSPHALLDSQMLYNLGKAYLYSNIYSNEDSKNFQGNIENALTCFSLSIADTPNPRVSLNYTFIDAYLRARRASSIDIIEFQESSIYRELETSDYPIENTEFTNSIRSLLFLFRELKDMPEQSERQHYDAYITALEISENYIQDSQSASNAAIGILHTEPEDEGDKVTYQMQELIDNLMIRLDDNIEAASFLQKVSLDLLKTETGMNKDLSDAQTACKEIVKRLPIPQKTRDDLTLKSLEITKIGVPQVGVVLSGILQSLPKKMGRGVKVVIATVAIIIAASVSAVVLEYLGIINIIPWI